MLKWYLLSEIRVIYIRESEGGADRQTNRHTNNINWGSVNSAVGPFEAFSLEFALGLEVTMWLSAVSFCSSSSVSCSHWHLATRCTNLLAYTLWDSTQPSEGEGRGADLSVTPFICTEHRPEQAQSSRVGLFPLQVWSCQWGPRMLKLWMWSVLMSSPASFPFDFLIHAFTLRSLSISLSVICIKRLT